MEGTLLKWTNYYNGWQPRYFVLNEAGILSYYKSIELIHEGCKGSCLVVACEVKAHPNDPLRFDLIIPGEQFFCLKTKSQSERQQWLVALGSWKSRGTKSPARTTKPANSTTSVLVSHFNSIDDELKLKVQELRLYETALTQRIHVVKSIANDTPTPDVKKLDENVAMLNVTCDAFIHTLDECVKLATGGSTQSFLLSSPISPTNSNSSSIHRRESNEFNFKNATDTSTALPKQLVYQTFFSQLRHTFSILSAVPFKQIKSEQFLSICEHYFKLIDKFNATTFNSLRQDVNSNTNKLRNITEINPQKFQTLYSIIHDEVNTQTDKDKDSATHALLWLKRDLQFLACFLFEFGQGDKTVEDAMNKAYGQTLKPYHGWSMRSIYSVAFHSLPSNEDFLISLAGDSNEAREILFERQVLNEMLQHCVHMNSVLSKIHDFYRGNNLDSDAVIQ